MITKEQFVIVQELLELLDEIGDPRTEIPLKAGTLRAWLLSMVGPQPDALDVLSGPPYMKAPLEPAAYQAYVLEQEHMTAQRWGSTHAERNHLVILVAHMAQLLGWPAGRWEHPEGDPLMPAGYPYMVRVDTPFGQLSWHIHESQLELAKTLPTYAGEWDKSDRTEKYVRVRRAITAFREWVRPAKGAGMQWVFAATDAGVFSEGVYPSIAAAAEAARASTLYKSFDGANVHAVECVTPEECAPDYYDAVAETAWQLDPDVDGTWPDATPRAQAALSNYVLLAFRRWLHEFEIAPPRFGEVDLDAPIAVNPVND